MRPTRKAERSNATPPRPVKRGDPGAGVPGGPAVVTIGHSTRSIEEFLDLLRTHGVTYLADVRTIPRSRHNPQFNIDALPISLKRAGINYAHLPGLGGLRRPDKNSVNSGWRNASFRGFADYMQTADFQTALAGLIQLTKRHRVALMCAEAVPWRCHRSLIADALLVRGIHPEHIMSLRDRRPHALTPFAKVKGMQITYPAAPPAASQKTTRSPTSKRQAGEHDPGK